jgi:hypothetical protein
MKYLCLVYLSKEKRSACPDAVCFEAAKGLHPVETERAT